MNKTSEAVGQLGSEAGRILVAGGGSTGIGAAWEAALRGWKVLLVEKEACLGGMGRSIFHNGNYYDLGTHIFHTDNPGLLHRVQEAARGELIKSRQKIRIKWNGRFYQYPLSMADLFKKLPSSVLISCGLSFLKAQFVLSRQASGSAEEQLIRDYGKRLYDIFFRDYTERHWGIRASQLDPCLVQSRIRRTDLSRLFARAARRFSGREVSRSHTDVQPVAHELYYAAHGSGGLFKLLRKELERLGVEIWDRSELVHLEHRNGRIVRAACRRPKDTVEVKCDAVISSLPLDRLDGIIDSATPEKMDPLEIRSLIVSGFLVKKPEILDANFVYFQDAIFGRVSEPKKVGLSVTPEDHTLLLCEVACSRGDERWRNPEKVSDRVLEELVRENCLQSRSLVVDRHSIPVANAYPVYRKGFLPKVEKLQKRLQRFPNLFSAGRWGEFRYINMHVAMLSGIRAAEQADELLQQEG